MSVYVSFSRGRDDVCGPTFGPFDHVQQTYEMLRVDGDSLAAWSAEAGEWFLRGEGAAALIVGEHRGEFYSDFVVGDADDPSWREHHDCAAARATFCGETCDVEQRWDEDAGAWVSTGRVWDSARGEWSPARSGYVIERDDGSTDGLGDRVVFTSEEEAWAAAEHAFGRDPDPASDGPGGVRAWLRVRALS